MSWEGLFVVVLSPCLKRFICNRSTCPVSEAFGATQREGEKMEHRHGNMWKSIANHPSSQKSFLYFVNIRRLRESSSSYKKNTFLIRGSDHVSVLNKIDFNLRQIWEWWTNFMEDSNIKHVLGWLKCEADETIFHLTLLLRVVLWESLKACQ